MTSKEKRDTIMRDVVKPALKSAGYRVKENMEFVSLRDGCCLIVVFFIRIAQA